MRKRTHKSIPWNVWLSYLLACTFFLTGVTFSKHITVIGDYEDQTRVAGIDISVGPLTEAQAATPTDDSLPVYYKSDWPIQYKFDISSNSEVSVSYNLKVTLTLNSKPTTNTVRITIDGKPTQYASANTVTFGSWTFPPGENTRTHTITLFIENVYLMEADFDISNIKVVAEVVQAN